MKKFRLISYYGKSCINLVKMIGRLTKINKNKKHEKELKRKKSEREREVISKKYTGHEVTPGA